MVASPIPVGVSWFQLDDDAVCVELRCGVCGHVEAVAACGERFDGGAMRDHIEVVHGIDRHCRSVFVGALLGGD